MHVELTEILRCPNAHAESPLVASATRQVERRILQGTLGCPVCGREYPIQDGVVEFRTSVAPEGGARSGPRLISPENRNEKGAKQSRNVRDYGAF